MLSKVFCGTGSSASSYSRHRCHGYRHRHQQTACFAQAKGSQRRFWNKQHDPLPVSISTRSVFSTYRGDRHRVNFGMARQQQQGYHDLFTADKNMAQVLKDQIQQLNHGQPINVNSNKEVSQAIFGSRQSTSKAVLQQVAEGTYHTPTKNPQGQELAARILQLRNLKVDASETTTATLSSSSSFVTTTSTSTTINSRQANSFSTLCEKPGDESGSNHSENTNTPVDMPKLTVTVGVEEVATYESHVESFWASPSPSCMKSQVDAYWSEPLLQLTRPTARALVAQLDPFLCPMGYDPEAGPRTLTGLFEDEPASENSEKQTAKPKTKGQKGTFLGFVREKKEKYPDCILLVRCGDFYETFGVDSIMLVEHCGLNPMGGKAKAGCPKGNVKNTLADLTSAGFRVAVFEEMRGTDASTGAGATGGSKSQIKHRSLAQIVSDAAPTYSYGSVLSTDADALAMAPDPRPYVGVVSRNAGYTLVEVSTEARTVRVSERLTVEAVACRLAAYPPADPLFYVPPAAESGQNSYSLPFFPSRKDTSNHGPGARLRPTIIRPELLPEPTAGVSDVDQAKNAIVSAVLKMTESREEDPLTQRPATVEDFTLVSSSRSGVDATHTCPLYPETATQLGLMSDPAIPSLISYILPVSAPAATKRFLRRFLLTPPPPHVVEAMRNLVSFMKDSNSALPPLTVTPIGRVLTLLRAGEANAEVYGELLRALHATVLVLDALDSEPTVLDSLMVLIYHESGLAADPSLLRARLVGAIEAIEEVVSPLRYASESHAWSYDDSPSEFGNVIPRDFLYRNEVTWRGRVRQVAFPEVYARVEDAAEQLARTVAEDFWGVADETFRDTESFKTKSPVVFDINNNFLTLKEIPEGVDEEAREKYFHPRDRKGRLLRTYTTEAVQGAVSEYITACDDACDDVKSALKELSRTLDEKHHIPAVVQAAHANLVLLSAFQHAIKVNSLGWNMAETYERTPDTASAAVLNGVWPYWMESNSAVANSFSLDGMLLLTAPNMSGKSTLMRSVAAAALLTNCGLCAPLAPGSRIQRFDHIFVRGASSDVPTEQKSAFGAEMGDVAALMRCCGEKSLVFVDELGRGTSPRDGTRLAGAVVEAMAESGMNGFFATHLHDILFLPLRSLHRIRKKRMVIHDQCWTFRMEDGFCTDSMALMTAAQFGLPAAIIERAEELAEFVPASVILASSVSTEDKENVLVHDSKRQQDGRGRVVDILESMTDHPIVTIPPSYFPPASFDGRSSVYILVLDGEQPSYYVGETDNLRQRLKNHRAKKGKWLGLTTIVIPVPEGKSHARVLESQLIQKLAKAGMSLESTFDGQSIRSSRSS
jgi:DNA mismatch repair ATPase MutS